MRLAFEKAGFNCVLTCEIDESAIATYQANFKDEKKHRFHRDILDLPLNKVPKHDCLVAGFPCQPYSIAGLRKGLKDDRGGDIFLAMANILRHKKPRSFLLENVRGMLSHDDGKTFNFMINQLEQCGYQLKYKVLNSMTHSNIPQIRERVFVVGFRSKACLNKFDFPKEIKLTRTIQDCISKETVAENFYYDDRYDCFKEIKKFIKSKETLYQWRRMYVRENKSNACPTLTANMGSGGHNVPLLLDEKGIRKLTPRETANFQGFPKSFRLPEMAPSKLYHQIGNSVTVPLIKRIASEIYRAL